MASGVVLHPPTASSASSTSTFKSPELSWLEGTWHVTHSTLPMWKSKRNVSITYQHLSDSPTKIDDIVKYQPLGSDKEKTVRGIDTASPGAAGAWDWRGRGWLKIATSHWEVLGYGTHASHDWAVTYFAKTLFTPAGIDVYSREKGGLAESTIEAIKEQLASIEDADVKKLAKDLFEIQHDRA